MIESDLSMTLAETTATEKECSRDATTGAKDATVQKTGPSYAHSMLVHVQHKFSEIAGIAKGAVH